MEEEDKNIPEFGLKRENEEKRDGGCAIVFDPITQLYAVGKHHNGGFLRLFSGGVEEGEEIKDGILREVIEESGLHDFLSIETIGEAITHYYNSLKNVNRIGKSTCLLVILNSSKCLETKLEEHEKFDLAWVSAEEILSNWKARPIDNRPDHWIYFLKKSIKKARELGFDKTTIINFEQ